MDSYETNQYKKSNMTNFDDYYEISEEDFYPPEDNRLFRSGVKDIRGGDNFAEYVESFFELYGEELFDN